MVGGGGGSIEEDTGKGCNAGFIGGSSNGLVLGTILDDGGRLLLAVMEDEGVFQGLEERITNQYLQAVVLHTLF